MSTLTSRNIGRRLWSHKPFLRVENKRLSPFNPHDQPTIVRVLSKPGNMKRIAFPKYFDFALGETTEEQRVYMAKHMPRHKQLVFELVEALPLPMQGIIFSASTAAPALIALDHDRAVSLIAMQPHTIQKDILCAPRVLNQITPAVAAELILVQPPKVREAILSMFREGVFFEELPNGFTEITSTPSIDEQRTILKEKLIKLLAARKARNAPTLKCH